MFNVNVNMIIIILTVLCLKSTKHCLSFVYNCFSPLSSDLSYVSSYNVYIGYLYLYRISDMFISHTINKRFFVLFKSIIFFFINIVCTCKLHSMYIIKGLFKLCTYIYVYIYFCWMYICIKTSQHNSQNLFKLLQYLVSKNCFKSNKMG